jgi:exopolyphosphatase/guanosine-5'-triphosphate,3'-diphosphate pyrophosphatase
MAVSHSGFHKHGAYLTVNADLPGFTKQEQHILSILVLSQKGNLKKVSEALALPDLAKAILSLRLAILFSHSRIDLSDELVGVRIRHKIEIDIPGAMLRKHPTLAHWLQKEQAAWSEIDWPLIVRQY